MPSRPGQVGAGRHVLLVQGASFVVFFLVCVAAYVVAVGMPQYRALALLLPVMSMCEYRALALLLYRALALLRGMSMLLRGISMCDPHLCAQQACKELVRETCAMPARATPATNRCLHRMLQLLRSTKRSVYVRARSRAGFRFIPLLLRYELLPCECSLCLFSRFPGVFQKAPLWPVRYPRNRSASSQRVPHWPDNPDQEQRSRR